MSNALLSSKVVIREEEPAVRTIDAVQTSIVAAVGVTERGPIGVPTLVTSFEEYKKIFGGYTADSDLALAAAGFFNNDGQFLYVVRTVHFTDITDPLTKASAAGSLTLQTAAGAATPGVVLGTGVEPFEIVDADTLSIAVDGAGSQVATFLATVGNVISTNVEPFALVDGQTLIFEIDGNEFTVTFLTGFFSDIANATAAEVVNVINALITGGAAAELIAGKVTIASDKKGTSSSVEVTGGTAAAAFAFPAGLSSGTGNVADAKNVTVAEVKAIVEAAVTAPSVTVNDVGGAVQIVSDTSGASSSVHVESVSTADTKLGLDNALHVGTSGTPLNTLTVTGKTDGAYANSLQIQIADATDGDSTHFDLFVINDGLIVETYANLSMVDTADRWVEDVINEDGIQESNLISVEDLDASTPAPRPGNGTFGPLTGGDDGITLLDDNDFIGSPAGATGFHALDTVQDVNILIVPGQATAAIHNAQLNYVENLRDMSMFTILDPPAGQSATEIITYFETTAAVLGVSEFGAAYWPRVKILNPSTVIFGNTEQLTVAPSGIIAGVYARTDASTPGGVYLPPAGIEEGVLAGVLGFETDEVLDEKKRDLVFPKRINILTTFPGAPRHIDGSRCLKGNGNFPFVAQRRGAIFIEQSIKNGTEFARNKNNTPELRRTVSKSVRQFLIGQMRVGAFVSNDPDTAFFVDFSEKLNPPSEVNAGRMNGRIGLAFNTPAEWLILSFSRDTRALEAELAG